MKFHYYTIAVFMAALTLGCHREPGRPQNLRFPTYQILEPIADADPFTRTNCLITVPTQLSLHRGRDFVSITEDQASRRAVSVSVGKHMATGFSFQLFVYPDGSARPSEPQQFGLQSGGHVGLHGTSTLNASDAGIPADGFHYAVDLVLQFFETDVPPQHFWSPKTGRYKVLWEGTITSHGE